jgi:hypothetical protein
MNFSLLSLKIACCWQQQLWRVCFGALICFSFLNGRIFLRFFLVEPDSFADDAPLDRPPFFLTGKVRHLQQQQPQKKSWKLLEKLAKLEGHDAPAAEPVQNNMSTWVLGDRLLHHTRNHDSVLLEYGGKHLLINILGRWSSHVQVMDLHSGEQWSKDTNGSDPMGLPLNNLNHVFSVLVDAVDGKGGKEIWLPCGFNGDEIDTETVVQYVRIVDLDTLAIRTGPKIPTGGSGACVAASVNVVKGEPPMVCSFGGTVGRHDSGKFLPYTACYDRLRGKWWYPMGTLPYGLDHGNIAMVPKGRCGRNDPGRLIILNYRIRPYGSPRPEMWAFDLPENGWTLSELESLSMHDHGEWFLYSNISFTGIADDTNCPRDASGVVVANQGRILLNFGGVHYHYPRGDPNNVKERRAHVFSNIRSFDVCNKTWQTVGDLGYGTFALQSCASEELQIAVSCGGSSIYGKSNLTPKLNIPWCIVNRFQEHHGLHLTNRHGEAASKSFMDEAFLPGRRMMSNNSSRM